MYLSGDVNVLSPWAFIDRTRHARGGALRRVMSQSHLKPSPYQRQYPSNIVECYKLNDSFDNVECCFDKVESSFDNVAGVDGALSSVLTAAVYGT